MKVLLIGSEGSIGARYRAILAYLGHECLRYDPTLPAGPYRDHISQLSFDSAIVASPTPTHTYYCGVLSHLGLPFLCEKPLSLNPHDCDDFATYPKGYVVNNYAFVARPFGRVETLRYNYYRTGPHGLYFDCCQLLYLCPHAELHNDSPYWKLEINGRQVSYAALEESYVSMIRAFLVGEGSLLWTIRDGIQMTETVLERIRSGHA